MKIQSAKAGIGTGRAGLQAASGLFSNAGLFDKGVKSFHPNDLDPYLLFDAQSSMIGTLENPTLDLDPSKQDTLDVITATRAGTATYTDFNGLIATAPANTVRVDHVDGVPMILVEPSATNLVTYSEDFSNSQWLKNGVGTGVAPVVTLNAAESPDGTQNATKVVFDAGSGTSSNDLSTLEDLFSATNGASYTQSIYLKGETGGEKILVRNAGLNAYTTLTLTTEWARYEVTETAAQTFGYYSIGIRQGLGGVVLNSKITVYAYGAQVEAGSVATSLIRTAGSNVTRAQDSLIISGSDFSSFYNQSEGTVYTESVGRGYLDFNTTLAFSNDTAGESIYQRTPSNNQVCVIIDGSVVQAALSSSQGATGTLVRKAFSFKLNNFKGSQDGADITPDTSGTIPTVDRLHIGASATGHNKLNGHIKRLIYWPTHSDNL